MWSELPRPGPGTSFPPDGLTRMTLMTTPTPAHGIALTAEDLAFDRAFQEAARREAEDLAFDRAFREAAERELAERARVPEEIPPPRRAFDTEQLIQRRAAFRRVVVWVVGVAGAITLVAMIIALAHAIF